MPELPEVETVVRGLNPVLCQRRIADVEVLNPSSIKGSPRSPDYWKGRRIEHLRRWGKYILIEGSEGAGMAIHLRMTGWLGIKSKREIEQEKDAYVRVRFPLSGRRSQHQDFLLFRDIRKFGRIWFGSLRELEALPSLAKLGPDALDLKPSVFRGLLSDRRGRIKSLLLNQSILAGLGNIYADESLYRARIHPETTAHRISRSALDQLHQAVCDTLSAALKAGGTSIDDYLHPDGTPGWFQRELKVYGREGQPCLRCKHAIKRIVVGQRGSWFCPRCQRKRT